MLVFILRRLAQAIIVMLTVAFIAFMLFQYVGDPVTNLLGQDATPEQRTQLRRDLGLDDPFPVQFAHFVGNAVQGEFGLSLRQGRKVSTLIVERFPATLELALAAAVIALAAGIPLGVYAALRRGRFFSQLLMTLSLLGVSLPTFLIGILLILFFAVNLKWLPSFGRGDVIAFGSWTTGLLTLDGLKHLLLPAVALSVFQLTLIMRLVRSEMLEVLRADYIKFARARGLTDRAVYFGHALKNTLVPVITITGLQLGQLIAFAIITETVFQWPGMGLLFIQAVQFADIPVMAAYLCLIAFIFVTLNLLVDMLYFAVDPRLRIEGKAEGIEMSDEAYVRLRGMQGELTALRRELHGMPELGFQETRTAARVVEALRLCGVDELHTGIGRTGVVALIHGRHGPGRQIGLRADMDALPLQEENDFPWRSASPGLMHACGHDGHTAMLVGAARYLAQTRRFDGTAVLIFQPGEEGYAGAREMINDGLFERFPVESVYAMHNWPQMPAGHIGLNRGAMMAAADQVEITLHGRGGHGAHPHLAIDPVLIAGHLITAVQSLVSRNVAPLDQAVVSLCSMRAGDPGAFSVIPNEARLTGTVRTFKPEVQQLVEQRLSALVQSLALGFGGSATVEYKRLYPATINSAREADFAADVAERLVGAAQLNRNLPPSMGSEDFSFMLQAKPGAYLRLGQGRTDVENCGLHHPRYDFNDEVLPLGAALFAGLIEQGLTLDPAKMTPGVIA